MTMDLHGMAICLTCGMAYLCRAGEWTFFALDINVEKSKLTFAVNEFLVEKSIQVLAPSLPRKSPVGSHLLFGGPAARPGCTSCQCTPDLLLMEHLPQSRAFRMASGDATA